MKVYVIKNEQHSLLKQQEQAIQNKFNVKDISFINISAKGVTKEDIENMFNNIETNPDTIYIFMSPIPYFMKLFNRYNREFYVLHNDKREKKELPNGKIIMTVAKEGWEVL